MGLPSAPIAIDVYPPNKDYPAGVDLNIADSIVRAGADAFYPKRTVLADLLEFLPLLEHNRTDATPDAGNT